MFALWYLFCTKMEIGEEFTQFPNPGIGLSEPMVNEKGKAVYDKSPPYIEGGEEEEAEAAA